MHDELEAKRGRHRATLKRLALIDAESASVRAEVELMREVLNQAIENFKNSKEFKEEILKADMLLIMLDTRMIEMWSESCTLPL